MSWLPKKTVVVPIDFSDDSFEAARLGHEFVGENGTLHIVHVLPELNPKTPGVIWQTVDDKSRSEHAQKAIKKRLDEVGIAGASISVRFGDPAREIAQYAEEMYAELVVIPSRGRGGAIRVLIGSVAERVIHLAHCAVLVLRH